MISSHWDWITMLIYLFLSVLGMWCLSNVKHVRGNNTYLNKFYYFLLVTVWTSFASFRLVTDDIGGTDSISYIDFFENCNKNAYSVQMDHFASDVLFKWINQLIRYFTPDYHVFYIITYGMIVISIIKFFIAFCPYRTNYVPYVLSFYLFLRSINTFRSSLAISFLLIALTLFFKRKLFYSLLFCLAAVLTHKMMGLFILVIPFCKLIGNKQLDYKKIALLTILSYLVVSALVPFFMMINSSVDLGNNYGYYVSSQEGQSFFDNFWKIAFEQLLLFFLLYKCDGGMCRFYSCDQYALKSYKTIKLICVFDFLTIPICFVMGIWRGAEVFYAPRIVMWRFILYFLFREKKLMNIFAFFCFELWIIFRVSRTWEADKYMPYVFEPLLYLIG